MTGIDGESKSLFLKNPMKMLSENRPKSRYTIYQRMVYQVTCTFNLY